MPLQPVRGTKDIFGDDAIKFRYLIELALQVARRFGFSEISTPIFEFTDVFARTLGETSDVVSKEMYTFLDRGGDSLTLRPEGTAGVARCLVSEGLSQDLPLKLFYSGPMFRYERPQKGRQRQFHQIGIEMLGFDSPLADAECIAVAHLFLKQTGLLNQTTLELNSLGDLETRKAYRDRLVQFLKPFEKELSADSQKRLISNPLRILDSKDPQDQKIVSTAPRLESALSPASHAHFESVQKALSDLGIAYRVNPQLVRGLDYYSHTVFEFRSTNLGAQDAVLAGGRYDGLIEMMGGNPTPSVGWAAGLERLALLLEATPTQARPVSLIPLGDVAMAHAMKLGYDLRSQGHHVDMSYSGNLAKRMKRANKARARWALIFGDNELAAQTYTLKDLDKGEQKTLSLQECLAEMTAKS